MNEQAPARFETAASTHPGNVRQQNEDAYLDDTDAGVWAVADGMGGHQAGQLASHTVIEALRMIGPQSSAARLLERCEACVVEANTALWRMAAEQGTTIGTTLATLLTHDMHYACVWSGDSRIYLAQNGGLTRVSRDHTEVQDLVERGIITEQESRASPRRNVITRAIGVSVLAELEIVQGILADGDTFLLCSDGLTNHVADGELCAMLRDRSAEDACHGLVGLAIERGGADNVTVVVVRYHQGDGSSSDNNTIIDALRV